MFISEIFNSIQGEGTLSGVPSVFIRTSGCNLRCNWCDTPYASWHPEGTELSVAEILQRVEEYPVRHCVLTGGEPMVAPDVHALVSELRRRGKHLTLETAATIPPGGIDVDLASLSPKLANSRPDDRLSEAWRQRHERLRFQPQIVREWIDRHPCQLKFVVTSAEDLNEIREWLTRLDREIPPDRIFLMPEGTDRDTLRERRTWLAEVCRQSGFRYGNRLHIELFGHTRGT